MHVIDDVSARSITFAYIQDSVMPSARPHPLRQLLKKRPT
jgi:hypothetical protein